MASGLYLAFTHPRDENSRSAFNQWYDAHHIPEILSLDGVTGASRYRALDANGEHDYLAAYSLEGSDLHAIVERIHAETPNRTPTTTMRTQPPTKFRLFELLNHRMAR